MSSQSNWPVAIIGSGSIGTDLMTKILRSDGPLTMAAMAGIDPGSDGLARASRMGVATTADGVEGLLAMPQFGDIRLVFDATSARVHRANWAALADTGVRMLDLTPAAIGPYCVPAANLGEHLDATNLNMVSCGGQAAVPIVAAVAQSGTVSYAEIVSSISSKSAGPGTRANIDEFIETSSAALEVVGRAQRGKAVMILGTADPPILARNTVYCLIDGDADQDAIENDVLSMVERVEGYVPGYRLRRRIQFETFSSQRPLYIPETGMFTGTRVTVLLEGTDIMTSAAKATAERIAEATS